jgi:ABC-2 type transport system permease protein
MNALYVLWIRQLKRYMRSRSRIIGALGQPLMFLIALGYGFGAIFQRAGAGNYIDFLVPGVISQTILFTSVFSGSEIIWDRQFGFLKETLVAPVSRFYIMLGRTLGGATVATAQGLIVLLLSHIVGYRMENYLMLPLAIAFMFIIALMFTALGIAIASRLTDFQGFQLIINFLVMPLFFLSGALFPLSNLPKSLTIITRIDPLSYGVDAMRGTLNNASHLGLGLDMLVTGTLTLAFLAGGSYLFAKIEI